ncbi:hypothetical protein HYFRA_00013274 [Hymenoscyphus fraxineus]|uniref:Ubiquitin-like domain-containing protein n=1 Tax=Hymenoscyphus fraxineus TaxID=746836 RepID=A0A9N9LAW0_9HELO|nr:hypothetical protein HYFRA_00013274 [Hymenoscyphus fraxineus]
MAASFGFSIGDFIAGINLVIQITSALSSASESTASYAGLLSELYVLERALHGIKDLRSDDGTLQSGDSISNNPYSQQLEALHRASYFAASQCQKTIDRLLTKLKPFQGHLATNGKSKRWTQRWRKVRWAVLTEGEIEGYRAEIIGHVSAINLNLVLIQIESAKLHSQRTRSGQESIKSLTRQNYNNTMSYLVGTLGELGQKSDRLLEATDSIVRSNSQMVQGILQQQEIGQTPSANNKCKPITFIDAFGKETHFHLDFVYSHTVLQDWLMGRFKETGYDKIVNMEYAIEDLRTKRQITLAKDWQTVYPGMCLGMEIVYSWTLDQSRGEKWHTCPVCEESCVGKTNAYTLCDNCGVQFKRINDMPFECVKDEGYSVPESENCQSNKEKGEFQVARKDFQSSRSIKRRDFLSHIQNWYRRTEYEKLQMQAFRRFRFQPTRAEFELAGIEPWMILYRLFHLEDQSNGVFPNTAQFGEQTYNRMLDEIGASSGSPVLNPPNMLHGLLNMGIILFFYGESEIAETLFFRVLKETGMPYNEISSEAYDTDLVIHTVCNLATVQATLGKLQSAIDILKACIHTINENEENFFLLHSTLLPILWEAGNNEEAISALESIFLDKYLSWCDDFSFSYGRKLYEYMVRMKERGLLGFVEEESSSDEEE